MISAKDLRVGNIHEIDGLDIPREGIHAVRVGGKAFASITGYGIHLVETGGMEFKPIELTEEWLRKLGFEAKSIIWVDKWVFEKVYRLNQIQVDELESENCWAFGKVTRDNSGYITSMKYVHELQNLVYAITGEELEVKS